MPALGATAITDSIDDEIIEAVVVTNAAATAASAAAPQSAPTPSGSIDDLTRQLENFETSLPDYETLVMSLCQQETDNNSNS